MAKEPSSIGEKVVVRRKNGQFGPGSVPNPLGRPKGSTTATLRKALAEYERKHKVKFLEQYIGKAMTDNSMMRDLASRLYPALKALDANIDVQEKTVTDILALMGITRGSDTE